MKVLLRIISLFLSICVSPWAFAHPAGRDAQDGHFDHAAGTYHFHCGGEAHQHWLGYCPEQGTMLNSSWLILLLVLVFMVLCLILSVQRPVQLRFQPKNTP